MTNPDTDRKILTWELNGTACRELTRQIVDDGFVPDIILASPAAA